MYIKLLGTGSNQCIPAFACECHICQEARRKKGKHYRLNSSAIICDDKSSTSILIDMPPQIMSQLPKHKIDDHKLSAVLLSHRHSDHTLGLKYFFGMTEKKAPWRKTPISIFTGEYTLRQVEGMIFTDISKTDPTGRENLFNVNYINAFNSFYIKNIKVTVLETNHLNIKAQAKSDSEIEPEESFGYLFESSNAKIAYLVDANSELPEETIKILKEKKLDCLVLDCTYKENFVNSGHGNIYSIVKVKNILKPKKIIASHIGHNNLPYNELKRYLRKHKIIMGYDGMKINV